MVVALGLGFALSAAACGKGDAPAGGGEAAGEAGAAGEGGGEAGGSEVATGLVLEEREFAYEVQRNADQRKLVMKTRLQAPKGWEADPEAKPGPTMTSLLSATGEAARKNPFALSNVTLSATCHGQCTAAKIPEQIEKAPSEQTRFAGSGAKVLKEEKIRDGVWGFVIEADKGEQGKAYTVGVTHWGGPEWPYVIFCNAHLQREHAESWPQIYEACAEAVVTLEDPLMPADVLAKERAQLAQCPEETTLTYRADPEREGEPTELGEVVATYAHASRPGNLTVYIANFELETTRFRDAPLTDEQRAVKLSFEHRAQGEVLSGSYPTGYDGDQRVGLGLHVAGGKTLQWGAHAAEGAVEIIARTPERVCGRVSIKGGNRGDLEGAFVADIELGSGK